MTGKETVFSLYFWQPWIKAKVKVNDDSVEISFPNRILGLFAQGMNHYTIPAGNISNSGTTVYTDVGTLIICCISIVVAFGLIRFVWPLSLLLILVSVYKAAECFTTTWTYERNGITTTVHCPVYEREKLLSVGDQVDALVRQTQQYKNGSAIVGAINGLNGSQTRRNE